MKTGPPPPVYRTLRKQQVINDWLIIPLVIDMNGSIIQSYLSTDTNLIDKSIDNINIYRASQTITKRN